MQPVYRKIRPALLCGFVLAALIPRLPGAVEGLAFNLAAKTATVGCGSVDSDVTDGQRQAVSQYEPVRASWLKVMEARCWGDDHGASAAMYEALGTSDARLDGIRAMARYDVVLARFAVETYPMRAEAQFWLAEASAKRKDNAGAIEAYERGLDLQATDGNMWLTLGVLYEDRGDLQEAVRAYDQACDLGDTGSNGCEFAGRLYLKLGHYELAAESYQASVNEIDHVWLPSEQGLAAALIALGRGEEAVPHLAILAESGSTEAKETLRKLQASSK